MKKAVMYGINEWSIDISKKIEQQYEIEIIGFIKSQFENEKKKDEHILLISDDELKKKYFDLVFIGYKNINKCIQSKQYLRSIGVSDKIIISLIQCYEYKEVFADSRIAWIRDFGKYVNDNHINGNVAECGVYKGETAMFLNDIFSNRKLYLFDTFEGFNECDLREEQELNNASFNKSIFINNPFKKEPCKIKLEDLVISRMINPCNVCIIKGHFPETAINVDDLFCLVHLDMDLYRPTYEGLKFFYNKMAIGGVILVHDYFHPNLPGVKKAIEDFENKLSMQLTKIPIGDGCSIAIVRR